MAHTLQGQGAFAADMQARYTLLQEEQRAVTIQRIVGEGIDALRQAFEPAALGVSRSQLRRHPDLPQRSQVERNPAGKVRHQLLEYLVSGIFTHG
ncbi:hypothetical protein D3C81_1770610 [compost metagenome]